MGEIEKLKKKGARSPISIILITDRQIWYVDLQTPLFKTAILPKIRLIWFDYLDIGQYID